MGGVARVIWLPPLLEHRVDSKPEASHQVLMRSLTGADKKP